MVITNVSTAGSISSTVHTPTFVERLRTGLAELLESDHAVVLLGEDIVDPYGGAFKVTKGLSSKYHSRVLATPICEYTLVGMAVGMALRGLRPIVEIMFGDFLTLACDQLVNHAAKYGPMYAGRIAVPLVVRTAVGGGRGYGPTHSQCLEKLFLGIPNLTIVAPSCLHDPADVLRRAVAHSQPVLFLEHKLLYPLTWPVTSQFLHSRYYIDEYGYPIIELTNYDHNQTADVTILAYGGVSRLIVPLMDELHNEEIRIQAFFPSCVSPLSWLYWPDSVRESSRLLIVEENCPQWGWGAEIAARLAEREPDGSTIRVKRIGAEATVIPSCRAVEDRVLPSRQSVLTALDELLVV